MAAGAVGRGYLIVFEGPEGVGKTTQLAALLRRIGALGGRAVHAHREPGGTPVGDRIRALLLEDADGEALEPAAEALLFVAARAQLVPRIERQLRSGAIVLLDRFFLSTYAYQIVGRALPAADVRAANHLAVGGLVPDLTLLLSCDLDVARARMQRRGDLDRIERAGDDFHARVTAAFLATADPAWQRAHPEVGAVVRIEASGDEAAVAERIVAVLADRWPETFRSLVESQ